MKRTVKAWVILAKNGDLCPVGTGPCVKSIHEARYFARDGYHTIRPCLVTFDDFAKPRAKRKAKR